MLFPEWGNDEQLDWEILANSMKFTASKNEQENEQEGEVK